jgi:hypothetical protein
MVEDAALFHPTVLTLPVAVHAWWKTLRFSTIATMGASPTALT